MQSDNSKMDNKEYRDTVFLTVFNTESGKLVLDWLDKVYRINTPDMTNPNDVYYRLGKQSVVNHIRTITENAKGGK